MENVAETKFDGNGAQEANKQAGKRKERGMKHKSHVRMYSSHAVKTEGVNRDPRMETNFHAESDKVRYKGITKAE